MEKYAKKGAQVSVEGRFTSSTYQNNEGNNITRYEVTADRVELLESRATREKNAEAVATQYKSVMATGEIDAIKDSTPTETAEITFAKESAKVENESTEENEGDVPWELDL
ncbi:MAG: hypothetical protein DSZ21_02600 [Tenericutes bacterium]|nr:MAG: hypothetical protein DSZ21_02600 [Mycoplasmatota bacterium]